MLSAICCNLDQSKILLSGTVITSWNKVWIIIIMGSSLDLTMGIRTIFPHPEKVWVRVRSGLRYGPVRFGLPRPGSSVVSVSD